MRVSVPLDFYDDIPETLIYEKDRNTFSSLSSAQAYFTNSVFKSINEAQDSFPVYDLSHSVLRSRSNQYMKTWKRTRQSISILWTGPDVCSNVLSADNAELAENAFKGRSCCGIIILSTMLLWYQSFM